MQNNLNNNDNNNQWVPNGPGNQNAGGGFITANFHGDYHHTDNHNRSVVFPEASTYNTQSLAHFIAGRQNENGQQR
jgi:hypothetical protein